MAKKLPKVLNRPRPAQPANDKPSDFDTTAYLGSKLAGVIRRPSVAKKVGWKKANVAASPGADKNMPQGGNTAPNKGYPGV